jgi:hypothetical protein
MGGPCGARLREVTPPRGKAAGAASVSSGGFSWSPVYRSAIRRTRPRPADCDG